MWFLFEICSSSFQNCGLNLQQVFHYSAWIRQNRLLVLVQELVKLFCSNYWKNSPEFAAVYYFHYNSHHHYHNHCKMHLYCLKVLLTSPLYCNMIPCLFKRNFVFFFAGIYFSLVLLQAFRFLRPVKGLRISLRPSDIF